MSTAPEALKQVREYLMSALGVDGAKIGIVGNTAHTSGYHIGKDRMSGAWDYSVDESTRDRNGLSNYASAIDIGTFTKGRMNLRDLSMWLVEECIMGEPYTQNIREIIYSPDGKTVKRWDRLNRRNSGDNSHLTHTHISIFRDASNKALKPLFERYVNYRMALTRDDIDDIWNTDGILEAPSSGLAENPDNTHWTARGFLSSIRDQVVNRDKENKLVLTDISSRLDAIEQKLTPSVTLSAEQFQEFLNTIKST